MSISSLRQIPPRQQPDGKEGERLRQFATAMAQRDRSRHRRWLRDDDVESAIRGYAYAAAIAEHRILTLTGDDIDGALAAYREARRLPVRHEPSQRSLIALIGAGTESSED